MVLNYLWIGFFIVGFIVSLARLIFIGDTGIFPELVNSTFDSATKGFELSLYLTGIMTLWLGLLRVGEKGGVVNVLSRLIGPFFSRLFPDIPKNHPVNGSILLNITSNMLGLDNAATPIGLKAMSQLQELNTKKDTASNSMIMFLVLNTSGLTLIPITIMVYRASFEAASPTDVFLPILLATFCSTFVGILAVSISQKINLLNKYILLYMGGFILLLTGIIWYFTIIPKDKIEVISTVAGNLIIFCVIIAFILLAVIKKVNVYEAFIDGAKDGFKIAIKIIPYLVAILVAIAVFRTSGTLDFLIDGIRKFVSWLGMDTSFVDALPTAFLKPLSGGASRGMMLEIMQNFGPDSFAGRLSCIFQGSTDTTFYIIAVYFGAVGIKKTRNAITLGLLADFAGIIAAIFFAYLFFPN
ncbi:MAG: nucleoside recognition domain-containing protein [Marinilabiliales bacterium]